MPQMTSLERAIVGTARVRIELALRIEHGLRFLGLCPNRDCRQSHRRDDWLLRQRCHPVHDEGDRLLVCVDDFIQDKPLAVA